MRHGLPPLPAARRARLAEATGAAAEAATILVELGLDELVLAATDLGADGRRAVTRAVNEVAADAEAGRKLDPGAFARLIAMEQEGTLTPTQAKQVLAEMLAKGGDPDAIAGSKGFEAIDIVEMSAAEDEAVSAYPL